MITLTLARYGLPVKCRVCGSRFSFGPLRACPGCNESNFSYIDRPERCPYCDLPRGHSPSRDCTGEA